MKTLTMKKVIGCMALSSVVGLTACQSMTMDQQSSNNGMHHNKMWHGANEKLTDSQVIKVLSTANNGEIMQANAALPKLQMAQTRNYAQMMINEHSMNEQKGQALASRLQLMPQASKASNSLQNDSNKIVNKLSQSTSATDRDYMMSQVKVHRKVLMTIDNQLIPNAKNPELQAMLAQTRNAVAMHLQMAEQLVASMK